MSSVRKIVRAVNLESKRIEKNFGISIPQLLTLKYLNESPEYRSTMRNLREVLSLNAPVGQRILWAFMEGAVAIALLVGGGLKTMQAASISTGILFLIVLFIMCWSLVKSLGRGHKKRLKKFKKKHPNAWVESDA